MSDFKAKMHQVRFRRLGLRPRPRWTYSAPSDPLAGLRGPTSKWRGGTGLRGGKGRGREGGKGMEERKGERGGGERRVSWICL